jgi:hypothetical protein
MTRKELLHALVLQARANGFDYRAWFQSKVGLEWAGIDACIDTLATEKRYYALLFSHDFAQHFWKQGEQMQFVVPTHSFSRLNARGETIVVNRKAYTRRTLKPNAWRYHLREMATFEEPLRYIRRFLITAEKGSLNQLGAQLRTPAPPLPGANA